MTTRRELSYAYVNCLNAIHALEMAEQHLSRLASEAYGDQIEAEICGGDEIEFRRYNGDYVDENDCLRIEDILEKLEE